MRKVRILCNECSANNLISKKYYRDVDMEDALIEKLKGIGGAVIDDIDATAEKIHHGSMGAMYETNHGEFRVFVLGSDEFPRNENIGMLEVTRDINAKPIFYAGGKRLKRFP